MPATLSVGTTAKGTFTQNGGTVTIGGKLGDQRAGAGSATLTGGIADVRELDGRDGREVCPERRRGHSRAGMSASGAILARERDPDDD